MITLDPVKIEAYDSETKNRLLFTVTTVDDCACMVEIKAIINNRDVDEITDAIKTAVKMLRLA